MSEAIMTPLEGSAFHDKENSHPDRLPDQEKSAGRKKQLVDETAAEHSCDGKMRDGADSSTTVHADIFTDESHTEEEGNDDNIRTTSEHRSTSLDEENDDDDMAADRPNNVRISCV
jgi:hypothetical protein